MMKTTAITAFRRTPTGVRRAGLLTGALTA